MSALIRGGIYGAPDVARGGGQYENRHIHRRASKQNAPWLYSLPASTMAVMEYMKKKHWVTSQRMDIIFALLSCGLSVKPWRWLRMRAGWKDCIWGWRGGSKECGAGREGGSVVGSCELVFLTHAGEGGPGVGRKRGSEVCMQHVSFGT